MIQTRTLQTTESGTEHLYNATMRALKTLSRGKTLGLGIPTKVMTKMMRLATQVNPERCKGEA